MEADVFWKKVKQILTGWDRNQEWLCEQAGIPLSTLRNKICISRMPTFEEVMKILKVFKMTLEEFTAYPETLQKDVINIPVYEQAFSAGRGQEFGDSSEIIDYVALPNELKKYTDSMEPTLFDNDVILYDNFGYDGTDGIYAINYRGASFVKRLQRAKDFVRIISDNKKYDEMSESGESEDFRVIGKVRYVVHKVQG